MTGLLDENFSQLKSRLDTLESNVIEAIKEKTNQEITRLNTQVQELMQMMKEKDEFIKNLVNDREGKSHGECHEQLHKQQDMKAAKNEPHV